MPLLDLSAVDVEQLPQATSSTRSWWARYRVLVLGKRGNRLVGRRPIRPTGSALERIKFTTQLAIEWSSSSTTS